MLNLFNFVSLLKNIFVLDFFKESFLRALSRHLKIISKNDDYLPWKIPELNFKISPPLVCGLFHLYFSLLETAIHLRFSELQYKL